MIKQLKAVLSTTGQLFSNNSKNPLLLFGTHVVEWSDTVEVPFSDAQKKFFEFLSIVQLPIAFFGSRLVPLINYAIGPSTLNSHESSCQSDSGSNTEALSASNCCFPASSLLLEVCLK